MPQWLPLAPYLLVALGYAAWMRHRFAAERTRRARLRELYPAPGMRLPVVAPANTPRCRTCGASGAQDCDPDAHERGLHG